MKRALGFATLAAAATVWLLLGRSAEPEAGDRGEASRSVVAAAAPEPEPRRAPTTSLRLLSVAADRTPIARASLLLHDPDRGAVIASATSDASGRATLAGLTPGDYTITALHPDYAALERKLRVNEGDRELVLELARGALIAGHVVGPRGEAVPNAMVRVLAHDSTKEYGHRTTDERGAFRVGGLPLGTFRLYVHTGRYRPRYSEAVPLVVHGETREVSVPLELGERVAGRVVDDRGHPVAGARVGSSDQGSAFTVTDDAGRFELGGMGTERVNVFAVARGYAATHLNDIRPGASAVDLVLRAPARLSVPLRNGGRAAVELRVCRPETRPEVCVAAKRYADAPAVATLENLPAGKLALVIEQPGKKALRVPVELHAGERSAVPMIDLSGPMPRLSSQPLP